MKITGHETDEMGRRYERVDDSDMQKAIEALESYLLNNDRLTTKPEKETVH
jgi:hypothetical protein